MEKPRLALNLLQRLSGIATLTRAYVEALAGTKAQVLDARKTTPGFRALDLTGSSSRRTTSERRGAWARRCGGPRRRPPTTTRYNFPLEALREAVRRVGGPVPLEASGNMTLERAKAAAEAGVDYVSVGALTHSAKALDLSLLVVHP
jgi:nicotinate-nucleotide pyrophosphorylase (carboxylating)